MSRHSSGGADVKLQDARVLAVLALGAVLVAALLSGCGEKQEEAEPVVRPVKTVVVGEGFMGTRSFPGRVEASDQVELSFRVSVAN